MITFEVFPFSPLLFIHQESKCEIFITIKIGGKLLKKKELKNLAAGLERWLRG